MGRAVATLCLGLAVLGCAPAVEFDVDVEGETVVEGGGALGVLGGFPVFDNFLAFDIADNREFENQQTSKDHVREARLTAITLTVVEPESADFDFLNEISFFVESPTQARQRVATKQVPNGVTVLELDLDDVELAPYVRDETFSITTTANGRQPANDVTVHAAMTLHIVASP